MEQIIKETTEKLSNGTITRNEADKILLDLFGVIKRSQKWLWILGLCSGWMAAAICFILLW